MTTRDPELARALKSVSTIRAKMRDADDEDKDYYRKCIAGWRLEIKKLRTKA